MNEPRFQPGSIVLIESNPHHPRAEEILGTVRAYLPGAGLMGVDLYEVEYQDPSNAEVHVMPFAPSHLAHGEPGQLLEAAERYEALAGELRDLAAQRRAQG